MVNKEEFKKLLGKNIKKLREKRKMSQEELADKADFYRTYIGHLENGRYNASAYVLYKLSETLEIDPKEFFPS